MASCQNGSKAIHFDGKLSKWVQDNSFLWQVVKMGPRQFIFMASCQNGSSGYYLCVRVSSEILSTNTIAWFPLFSASFGWLHLLIPLWIALQYFCDYCWFVYKKTMVIVMPLPCIFSKLFTLLFIVWEVGKSPYNSQHYMCTKISPTSFFSPNCNLCIIDVSSGAHTHFSTDMHILGL
jgi:hypothetical protein